METCEIVTTKDISDAAKGEHIEKLAQVVIIDKLVISGDGPTCTYLTTQAPTVLEVELGAKSIALRDDKLPVELSGLVNVEKITINMSTKRVNGAALCELMSIYKKNPPIISTSNIELVKKIFKSIDDNNFKKTANIMHNSQLITISKGNKTFKINNIGADGPQITVDHLRDHVKEMKSISLGAEFETDRFDEWIELAENNIGTIEILQLWSMHKNGMDNTLDSATAYFSGLDASVRYDKLKLLTLDAFKIEDLPHTRQQMAKLIGNIGNIAIITIIQKVGLELAKTIESWVDLCPDGWSPFNNIFVAGCLDPKRMSEAPHLGVWLGNLVDSRGLVSRE